jgi:pimeloyl-ACP methyl ester carboxylesterase
MQTLAATSATTVTSDDGTPIAFTRTGQGPPLILVDGALCHRAFGPSRDLAPLLAARFTVITYDRRGRGESDDAGAYCVEREIEDIAALIEEAREGSGAPHLFGISSGAALALEAANRRLPIAKLALYEAPFIVDDTREPIPDDFLDRLNAAVAAERRSEALTMFMKLVGAPGFAIAMMRLMPMWKKLKQVAHTLPYDITIVQDYQRGRPLPRGRWTGVEVPTLVMDGGKSPAWMRNGARALADAIPGAQQRTLEGQTHMVKPGVLAPVLIEFFSHAANQ